MSQGPDVGGRSGNLDWRTRTRARRSRWAATILGLTSTACGFGLMQTGFTTRPGTLGFTAGATHLKNRIDRKAGRNELTNTGLDLGLRVGLTERIDLGIAPFWGMGGKLDGKMNVAPRGAAYAISPRLGGGYALEKPGEWHSRSVFMAMAGGVGSYRFTRTLEPYIGLSYASHWVSRDQFQEQSLAQGLDRGEQLAARTGVGNGLLAAVVGLHFHIAGSSGLMAEYGHWFPMQNDPGDLIRLLPSDLFVLGVTIHAQDVQFSDSVQ